MGNKGSVKKVGSGTDNNAAPGQHVHVSSDATDPVGNPDTVGYGPGSRDRAGSVAGDDLSVTAQIESGYGDDTLPDLPEFDLPIPAFDLKDFDEGGEVSAQFTLSPVGPEPHAEIFLDPKNQYGLRMKIRTLLPRSKSNFIRVPLDTKWVKSIEKLFEQASIDRKAYYSDSDPKGSRVHKLPLRLTHYYNITTHLRNFVVKIPDGRIRTFCTCRYELRRRLAVQISGGPHGVLTNFSTW